ncbi:MAG: hypothetical protein E6J90_23290 [Deltaproteobacteria bacterium]|nr:MAG: hypothetical protein E6J91_42265 [Deltaproteobacteria bacterium]TMQ16715.1 MAG: hypothetical protein E6J90_23290 [Deltaproteobacteria bacterium]
MRGAAAGSWVILVVWAAADPGCTPQSRSPAGAAATSPVTPGDGAVPDAGPVASQITTWTCTASPCPWGGSLSNHALVWPAAAGAARTRLGYSVSAGVYLPAARANGADIAIETGEARVHAGPPDAADHRLLATIKAGQTFHVTGLAAADMLSVQADAPFTCRVTLPPPGDPRVAAAAPPRAPDAPPPHAPVAPPPRPAGPRGPVVRAIPALWRCHRTPGCFSDPWTGAVITWPAWAAHQDNGRSGNVLRFVHATSGEPLYPYMGAWAEGCEVTAESGTAMVIEWHRGAEAWRETVLTPGQSHVIHLVPPEDGALIEAPEGTSAFSVSLRGCTPRRIEP